MEKESEYEEEEVLIYAQFDALLDEELFEYGPAIKIIGLDTDEPYVQVGNQMYCGKWKDLVGTALFFEEVESPPPSDPVFSETPAKTLKYQYKTRKGLELSRVFIKPKNETADSTIPDDDSAKISEDYAKLEDVKLEENSEQKEEEQ